MNSAKRVLQIYDNLVSTRQDTSMRQVWASVFELNESDPELEDNLVELLTALRKKVDEIRLSLTSQDVPDELTHPGFARLKETASTSNLNASWSSFKSNIQAPETRLALCWASWVLRNENQRELDNEGLMDLLNELKVLEESILKTEMSAKLRAFLMQKIQDIKNAILLSKVEGSESIKNTFESIVGSIVTVDANLTEEINKSEDKKSVVNAFVQKFRQFAEFGDNLEKLIALGNRAGKVAGFLVDLNLGN